MPEGHVIHRLAGELTLAFAGRPVRVSSPQGRFAEASALLDGAALNSAQAFGKHLLLDFSPQATLPEEPGEERAGRHEGPPPPSQGPFVHIHLGLIGKLRWVHPGPVEGAATLRLRIESEEHAAELRGPQTCALIGADEVEALVAELGPDPLRPDADPDRGWRRVHRSARSIASLLMDQRVAAGVGNIYRAEVLYRQRIHPDTPGNTLSPRTWRRIWDDLVELMPQGVRHGRIDTVRAEHSPEAMGRDAARRPSRRRGLRLPAGRPALPGVRTRGQRPGVRGPQSLLVRTMPTASVMHWGDAEVRVAEDGTSIRLVRGPDLVVELSWVGAAGAPTEFESDDEVEHSPVTPEGRLFQRQAVNEGWRSRWVLTRDARRPAAVDDRLRVRPGSEYSLWSWGSGVSAVLAVTPAHAAGPVLGVRLEQGYLEEFDDPGPSSATVDYLIAPSGTELSPGQRLVTSMVAEWYPSLDHVVGAVPRLAERQPARRGGALVR